MARRSFALMSAIALVWTLGLPAVAGPTAPSLQSFDALGACSDGVPVVLVNAEIIDSEPLPEAFDLYADDVLIATPDPADVLDWSELVGAEYVTAFEFTVALDPGTYQVKLTVFGLFGQTSSDEIEVSVPSDCTAPEDGDIVFVKTLTPYTVWVDVNGEEVERPATAAVTYTWIDDRGVEVSRTIDDNVDFIVVAYDTDYLVELALPVGWSEVACDDFVDENELEGFDYLYGTGTFPSGTRPIIHTVCGQQDAPDGFSDVPTEHPFATEITWMVGEGITTGFPDGTFRPAQPVTRQAAAAFLWRLAGEPDVTSTAGFTDVPVEHPFHDEIAWMVQEGLTTGFPDDTFRPAQPVTRQAAAAFLYRYDGEPPVTGVAGFADVPTDHPFNDEIAWMVAEGITTGFPDDTFRPANDVTRQAMAAFLYRYETDAGGAGTGDLYIEKRVAGESAPSSWSFDFTVICDDVPAGFPGDRLETDFSFASDEVEGFYVAWEGFTVGTECTITETDSGEADSVQITVDGESVAGTAVAVVIEEGSFLDGTHTRVVFTNIFE